MNDRARVLAPAESFDLLRMDRHIARRHLGRRLLKVVGWTGLLALSLSKRGILGWLVAAGAVYGLVDELLDWSDERPEWRKNALHLGGGVLRRLLPASTEERAEWQSELSFPASDPPASGLH